MVINKTIAKLIRKLIANVSLRILNYTHIITKKKITKKEKKCKEIMQVFKTAAERACCKQDNLKCA